MSDVTDNINSASRWATLGYIHPTNIKDYLSDYEMIRDELLSRHIWAFTLDFLRESDVVLVEAPTNLGYKYTYQLPSDVLKVFRVNAPSEASSLGVVDGLRIGIAIDTSRLGEVENKPFRQVGSVLHTDEKVEEIAVSRRVDERLFTDSFNRSLVLYFAEFLALTIKKNLMLAGRLGSKARELHTIAIDDLMGVQDQRILTLYNWVRKYYRGISY